VDSCIEAYQQPAGYYMFKWLNHLQAKISKMDRNYGVWNESTYNPTDTLPKDYRFTINNLTINSANVLHSDNDQGGLYGYTTTPYIDKTIATIVWTTISILFFFSVAIIYSKTDFK
jgi:hypothetical protein